jgi:hypothetical protein
MPYKDTRPYSRAWIKRELEPRITKYAIKTSKRKIDIVSDAVDKFLKDAKY